MSSDQMAKHDQNHVYQKVIQGLSGLLLNRTSLLYLFGLAAFYAWNLTDVYASPLMGADQGLVEIKQSTTLASLCNTGSYILIAVLFSRLRSFYRLALGAAICASLAVLGSWVAWALNLADPLTAVLVYRSITRICSAFVIVAWGMRYSDLGVTQLTQQTLAAFCIAALAFLVVDATSGMLHVALFALLLPLSMLLCMRAIKPHEASDPAKCAECERPATTETADHEPGGRSASQRTFLSLVWRALLVFSLFGVLTWGMIINSHAGISSGYMGSIVALASFVAIFGLLATSCVYEGAISPRYIYKLVLPLVMIGLILVAAFDGFQGIGAAIVSVGYTCFDLFCFVMVATACQKSGVRSGAAFGWYRALESFIPMLAMGLMWLTGHVGIGSEDKSLYMLIAACSIVLAVVLVLDRGNILDRHHTQPNVVYPRAEVLYFARQCEDAIRRFELSPREAEVLSLVVRGRSVPHIAERLYISRGTVKTHITRIYQKLGVSDRQEMIDVIESLELPDGGTSSISNRFESDRDRL